MFSKSAPSSKLSRTPFLSNYYGALSSDDIGGPDGKKHKKPLSSRSNTPKEEHDAGQELTEIKTTGATHPHTSSNGTAHSYTRPNGISYSQLSSDDYGYEGDKDDEEAQDTVSALPKSTIQKNGTYNDPWWKPEITLSFEEKNELSRYIRQNRSDRNQSLSRSELKKIGSLSALLGVFADINFKSFSDSFIAGFSKLSSGFNEASDETKNGTRWGVANSYLIVQFALLTVSAMAVLTRKFRSLEHPNKTAEKFIKQLHLLKKIIIHAAILSMLPSGYFGYKAARDDYGFGFFSWLGLLRALPSYIINRNWSENEMEQFGSKNSSGLIELLEDSIDYLKFQTKYQTKEFINALDNDGLYRLCQPGGQLPQAADGVPFSITDSTIDRDLLQEEIRWLLDLGAPHDFTPKSRSWSKMAILLLCYGEGALISCLNYAGGMEFPGIFGLPTPVSQGNWNYFTGEDYLLTSFIMGTIIAVPSFLHNLFINSRSCQRAVTTVVDLVEDMIFQGIGFFLKYTRWDYLLLLFTLFVVAGYGGGNMGANVDNKLVNEEDFNESIDYSTFAGTFCLGLVAMMGASAIARNRIAQPLLEADIQASHAHAINSVADEKGNYVTIPNLSERFDELGKTVDKNSYRQRQEGQRLSRKVESLLLSDLNCINTIVDGAVENLLDDETRQILKDRITETKVEEVKSALENDNLNIQGMSAGSQSHIHKMLYNKSIMDSLHVKGHVLKQVSLPQEYNPGGTMPFITQTISPSMSKNSSPRGSHSPALFPKSSSTRYSPPTHPVATHNLSLGNITVVNLTPQSQISTSSNHTGTSSNGSANPPQLDLAASSSRRSSLSK